MRRCKALWPREHRLGRPNTEGYLRNAVLPEDEPQDGVGLESAEQLEYERLNLCRIPKSIETSEATFADGVVIHLSLYRCCCYPRQQEGLVDVLIPQMLRHRRRYRPSKADNIKHSVLLAAPSIDY